MDWIDRFDKSGKVEKYRYQISQFAINAEAVIADIVSFAVSNVVVKNVVVQARNIIGNFVTAGLHGVPLQYKAIVSNEALHALEEYQRDATMLQRIELRTKMKPELATRDSVQDKIKFLNAKLEHSIVHKFMDAGLFGSIVDDYDTTRRKYRSQHLNQLENKLVEKFGTHQLSNTTLGDIGRAAFITEETALFKALVHGLHVSDFIAKFAVYKHLTEQQGVTADDAYEQIQGMYVNYNVPLHKYLQWANNIGLVMFVKYFIGVQKAGIRLMRERPVTSIAYLASRAIFNVNSPSILDSSILLGHITPYSDSYIGLLETAITPPLLQNAKSIF